MLLKKTEKVVADVGKGWQGRGGGERDGGQGGQRRRRGNDIEERWRREEEKQDQLCFLHSSQFSLQLDCRADNLDEREVLDFLDVSAKGRVAVQDNQHRGSDLRSAKTAASSEFHNLQKI